MKRRGFPAALVFAGLLVASTAQAHSIVYAGVVGDRPITVSFTASATPTQNGSTQAAAAQPGIAAQFSYSGSLIGVPANAEFRVYGPDSSENAYQSGRADQQGRVVFVPDRAGLWRVELRTPEGHEATASLTVGDDLAVPPAAHWLGWLLLLSLTANLTLFVFFRQRKKAERLTS